MTISPASTTSSTTHTETEGRSVTINIPDHPGRAESPGFAASKRLAKKILATLPDWVFGTDSIQMHHGGSLWVFDGTTWHLYLNVLGMEWSSQFCADPAKVDLLRRNARALYEAFPLTVPEMERLGDKTAQQILDTPITDSAGIARWVDSIFNSCVPLPAKKHTGSQPTGSGEHHYPRPITNIEFVKRDDFQLWHHDPESGTPVAVVPTTYPGTVSNATVQLVYATPGTKLHARLMKAQANGQVVELGSRHPITKAAFAAQNAAPASPSADAS